MSYSQADYQEAVTVIRQRVSSSPKIGLVLGSGLGSLAETIVNRTVVPYSDIPHWPKSTVPGHSGQLVIGQLEGQPVVVQQGRAHFYEGYDLHQVTFPIRVMRLLGVETVILTNAAGGLNRDYDVGDLMALNDHIYFTGLAGNNALSGPNDETFGERFVGLVQTYDRQLRGLAQQAANAANIKLYEGVYACVAGPTFETPAEVRMLRMMGADAVGMSTVHEVVVARHAGMRVLAFSAITNQAIDTVDTQNETTHEEVLDAGRIILPKLTAVLTGVLRRM